MFNQEINDMGNSAIPELAMNIAEFEELGGRLSKIATRLAEMGDRVVAPTPASLCSTDSSQAPPSAQGYIKQLARIRASMIDHINEVEDHISRLESAL